MKVIYKIMDGIEVLPYGFSYGKTYEIYHYYEMNEYSRYKIYNDYGSLINFNDIPYNSHNIWKYFITLKELRKLKLDEIG